MTTDQCRRLDEQGWVVLEDGMTPVLLEELRRRILRLFDEEGEAAGAEFKTEENARRLANLVDKGDVFRRAIVSAHVLEPVRHVLGTNIKLSSLNARSADPQSDTGQPLHVDMGAIADDRGYWVCNTIWMLDDFTTDNGPTRVVPGSHRWRLRPQDVLADPLARHPDEVYITGPAGAIVVMNSHLWHGGTANRTLSPRLAMHAFYCRRDKPQQQYQKVLLSPEVQAALTVELRDMLALDDPANDALSLAGAPRSGFLK